MTKLLRAIRCWLWKPAPKASELPSTTTVNVQSSTANDAATIMFLDSMSRLP